MANTKIVLNRQSDLILDNALITNPQGIVLTDISGVSEAVASINSATSADMSAEASSRVAGDLSLASNLSTEVSARAAAISAEVSDRVAGDVSVTAAMSAEISSRIVAEISLQNNIDAEESLRIADVDAEEERAIAAEGSLASDLAAEASRAIAAEASLNTKVEFVISNVDGAAIDSLTEIVSAFQSADGDINNAITNLANAAGSDLSAEVSSRVAGDASLAADLSTELVDRAAAVSLEEVARISADTSIALDLSAEIEARISDVNEEQARAESAEASLDDAKLDLAGGTMSGDIDMNGSYIRNLPAISVTDLATNSIGAKDASNITSYSEINQNGNAITNLPNPTNDGDATNKLYVDAADASIAADLSAEISARLDGGASISAEVSSSIATVVSDRIAADESLASTISTEIESLALTDEQTIELNTADNTIRLKDTIAAPESGVRTFAGEVDIESVLRVGEVDVMATLSTEVSRAEEAEASLAAAKLDLAGGTMSGSINMGDYDITNAASIQGDFISTMGLTTDNLYSLNGDYIIVNNDLDFGTTKLPINLPAPTEGGDATNKTYVDAADASLQSQIDFITNNVDPAAIDSLTEVVAAFQSADGDLNSAITNLANAATTDLSAEIARAESAEAVLTADLSSEVVNRGNAIDAEASLRIAAVSAEESRAIEAEALLAAAKLDLAGGTMSGNIDMGENNITNVTNVVAISLQTNYITSDETIKLFSPLDGNNEIPIINLPAPTNDGDATNKLYVDNADALKLDLAGGTMSGSIDMGTHQVTNVNMISTYNLNDINNSDIYVHGSLDFSENDGTKTIKNLPTPTNDGDAANKLYVDTVAGSLGSGLSSELSAEISRAEAAEASIALELSSEVSYIIANTDLTSIDSFAEVVADMSSEVARAESAEASLALDFANIYAKRVAVVETPNEIITEFSLASDVREGSELIYLNGLLLDSEDYTANVVDGVVSSVTFFIAPSVGDKVRAYGVY